MNASSVSPRRIAETLIAGRLAEVCGEITSGVIRGHVEALAYEKLIAPGEVDSLCDAVDEQLAEAADGRSAAITVTIADT